MLITGLLLVLGVFQFGKVIQGALFKVKLGKPNLKVLINHLLLVLELQDVKLTCMKSSAGNLLLM